MSDGVVVLGPRARQGKGQVGWSWMGVGRRTRVGSVGRRTRIRGYAGLAHDKLGGGQGVQVPGAL